jgi:hypothetical protein
MKKLIVFTVLAMLCGLLMAQDQEQAQAEPKAQDIDLKTIHFPQAFVHAGKEYPAGDYKVVLTVKEGQHLFIVSDAQQPEPLFEELAVVKAKSGTGAGSAFRIRKDFLRDKEYYRVKVIKPGQWLMGFFLIKK